MCSRKTVTTCSCGNNQFNLRPFRTSERLVDFLNARSFPDPSPLAAWNRSREWGRGHSLDIRDSNFNGSTSSSLNQAVNQASTTVSLSSSLNPSVFNQSVTFTAVLTPQFGGQATGTVHFMDGAIFLGSAGISGNTATLTSSSLAVGSHPITASYSGDLNFTGSTSSTLNQNVSQATTTTTLTSSPNPSGAGQSVNFTVTVTGQFGGTPTGTVTFKAGATTLGASSLSGGVASLSFAFTMTGTKSITAVYSRGYELHYQHLGNAEASGEQGGDDNHTHLIT